MVPTTPLDHGGQGGETRCGMRTTATTIAAVSIKECLEIIPTSLGAASMTKVGPGMGLNVQFVLIAQLIVSRFGTKGTFLDNNVLLLLGGGGGRSRTCTGQARGLDTQSMSLTIVLNGMRRDTETDIVTTDIGCGSPRRRPPGRVPTTAAVGASIVL